MDIFDTQYFRVNKLLLSFCGLWPMQSNKKKLLYFTILGTLIVLLPQIAYMFKRLRSLEDLYDFLPVFLGTFICFLKTIGLYWENDKFRILIEHVRHDWCLLEKHNDIWILMKYAGRSRMFTFAYTILISMFTVTLFTAPFTILLFDSILKSNVTRSKQMPHASEFFLDVEKYYYILMAITFIGYVTCCTIAIATDTIYFALQQHTCGTLAILSYRLEKLTAHSKSTKCFDHYAISKSDRNVENMVHCIQLQIRIERLIYLIESTFALSLFMDISVGILMQCSACVLIVTGTELVRSSILAVIQNVRLFFNNWIGQEIIDYSSQISAAAYDGMWYQTSLKAKKMLLFLIMKSQKPYYITVAKFYIICFESYSMLMRTTASYITVMISLNSEDM